MRQVPSLAVAALVLAGCAGASQAPLAPPQAKAPQGVAWVKVCETPTSPGTDLFGKPSATGARTCFILHEQLEHANAALRVAAGIRQAGDRTTFNVMVPDNVQQAAGARVDIFPNDLWQKVRRNEPPQKQETGRVRTLTLKFSSCRGGACTAETEATPSLLADLMSSGGFTVLTSGAGQQPTVHLVALHGFGDIYDGPSVDPAKFHAAKKELLRAVRSR
jgi:invasion protein IalB